MSYPKPYQLSKWATEDLIYAAAYLDGEGNFDISSTGGVYIKCANTHKPTILWLHKTFGGYLLKPKVYDNPKQRPVYTWQIGGEDAVDMCRSLCAYLKEKTPQALMIIAFSQTRIPRHLYKPGHGHTPENKQERQRLFDVFRGLKHVSW